MRFAVCPETGLDTEYAWKLKRCIGNEANVMLMLTETAPVVNRCLCRMVEGFSYNGENFS